MAKGNWMSTASRTSGQPTPTASADNAVADQRQNAWNNAAAMQYQQLRQQRLGDQTSIDLAKINTEQNRQLLAKAFGYDPKNSPPFGNLYTKYMGLPPDQKANIYKKGLVPWMDLGGEDQSGTDLVAAAAKKTSDHLDEYASHVSSAIQEGKVKPHKNPDGSINWTQIVEQPSKTPGLPPEQVEVPAFDATLMYINRAINSGLTPDPKTGKMAAEAPDAAPKPQMTTDQFQQILNARQGKPDAVDNFQNVLNQRAGISNGEKFGPYQIPSAQPSFSSVDPARLANAQPQDPFVAAHNYLASPRVGTDLSNINQDVVTTGNNVMDAIGAAGSAVANMVPRFYNAAGRLIFGANSPQIPTITPQAQQPAIDPQTTQQASIIQALRAQNPDAPIYDAQKQLGY